MSTALRIGNSKDAVMQGMKLLHSILDVLTQPDAKKILGEAISMTEEEIQKANDARSYIEQAARLRDEITKDQIASEQSKVEASKMMQDAKTASAQSKSALVNAENRSQEIARKHADKDRIHSEKDAAQNAEDQRLSELNAALSAQKEKQTARQIQLDEQTEKLRSKAAAAAQIMHGV